jgi:hypothetical protein
MEPVTCQEGQCRASAGAVERAPPQNRRTILADRIMVVLAGCSVARPKQCLSKLTNDSELPADIRMAIALKAFPDRAGGVRPARRAKVEIRTAGRTRASSLFETHACAPPPTSMNLTLAVTRDCNIVRTRLFDHVGAGRLNARPAPCSASLMIHERIRRFDVAVRIAVDVVVAVAQHDRAVGSSPCRAIARNR